MCWACLIEKISLHGILDSILATILCDTFLIISIIILCILCKRYQLIRAWIWWIRIKIFSNKFNAINFNPAKDFFSFYKNIKESIQLVSNSLGIKRTNQNSPPGMPLAIASQEFYEYVMDMLWLLGNKDVGNGIAKNIYEKITKIHRTLKGINFYPVQQNLAIFNNEWKEPLKQSFEGGNHSLMTYQEFTTIFTKSLWEIG